MVFQGRVDNGMVVLGDERNLPGGTSVTVLSNAAGVSVATPGGAPVELPLVRSRWPGSLRITAESVAVGLHVGANVLEKSLERCLSRGLRTDRFARPGHLRPGTGALPGCPLHDPFPVPVRVALSGSVLPRTQGSTSDLPRGKKRPSPRCRPAPRASGPGTECFQASSTCIAE